MNRKYLTSWALVMVPIAGLVSQLVLPAPVSAAEKRGLVVLNEEGDGVVIKATSPGTPDRRAEADDDEPRGRRRECSTYSPVLRFRESDVAREVVRPQSDLSALVSRGEGEDKEVQVKRTCRVFTPSSDRSSGVKITTHQESTWVSLRRVVGELARSALDQIIFPATRARFAPPAKTRTLVGVDTWFWVPAASWRPITKVVGAPPVVVTAVATPISLQFLPGDGSAPVTCTGPGLPWVNGGHTRCKHVYQRASTQRAVGRYRGVVTVMWRVVWASTTGASGTIGPVPRPQPVSVKVAEAEAVLTRS